MLRTFFDWAFLVAPYQGPKLLHQLIERDRVGKKRLAADISTELEEAKRAGLEPLTADVKHLEMEALEGELGLDDAGRLDSRPENILLGWYVLR